METDFYKKRSENTSLINCQLSRGLKKVKEGVTGDFGGRAF